MLSGPELEIVQDRNLFLTKQRITQCVYELFNMQVGNIRTVLTGIKIPPNAAASLPKISKGENYLGFPFIMLDYPAVFGKDILAVRTMFWWGNFFSVTLHISGKYKLLFEQCIIQNLSIAGNDIHLCVNDEEWQHHFDPSNYLPAGTISRESLNELLVSHQFMKIAIRYDLDKWNEMSRLLPGAYARLLGMINQLPTR